MSAPRPLPSWTPDPRHPVPVPDGPGPHTAAGSPRSRRRRATVLAFLVVVALVAVVALARGDAARTRELDAALATLDSAAAGLALGRRDGSAALAASAGRVQDEQLRRELAVLLVGSPVPDPPGPGPREDRTARAVQQAAAVRARSAALAEATARVRDQHARWLLTDATAGRMAAHARLGAAVAAGGDALAASEGRVLDDAPRAALRVALEQAASARGTRADGDLGGAAAVRATAARPAAHVGGPARTALAHAERRAATLQEEVAVLHAHTEALRVACEAVAAAESAWQAEQDRLAAERAAAERAAAERAAAAARDQRSAGGTSGGGAAEARRGSAGAPAGTGDPGPAPPPASEVPDGGWELPPGWTWVEETEGGAWCGDELGASWEC